MPNRQEMHAAIKSDYPQIFDDMIDLVLDLYEKNPTYIEDLIKQEKKKNKRVPQPKRQLNLEEFEKLHAAAPKPEQQHESPLVSEIV